MAIQKAAPPSLDTVELLVDEVREYTNDSINFDAS
jgi:hypothetical protein